MAHEYGLRALGQEAEARGRHLDTPHEHRDQRMRALLLALKTGPVDAARLAFTALVEHDPELTYHPTLAQIGAALQSSNMLRALQIAEEIHADQAAGRQKFQWQMRLSTPPASADSAHQGFIKGLKGRWFGPSA